MIQIITIKQYNNLRITYISTPFFKTAPFYWEPFF